MTVSRLRDSQVFAVLVLVIVLVAVWYLGSIGLNWAVVSDRLSRDDTAHSTSERDAAERTDHD